MNTKPDRDIIAEEPTTSTEWEIELYKVFYDETYKSRSRKYIKRYDRIKAFIAKVLTRRDEEWKNRISDRKHRFIMTTASLYSSDCIDIKDFDEFVDELLK